MELTQIRYFLETAKTQHITKSAEKLHIAQPALTKSIHNLEAELGVPLFMRRGRNVVLTPYGEYLRDKLAPVINSLDSIPAQLAHMAETENHTIRLSVLAASSLITHAIIDYKKIYPDISFRLIQNPDDELYDIEITTDLHSPDRHSSGNVFICTENIFLAVPDTEKYKGKKQVDLSEVCDGDFISLFGSKQLRVICDRFCREAGFEPNIVFDSDSPHAVKNMIAANLGVGFWPEFTWGVLDTDKVRLLPIKNPICKRDIIITRKSTKADNTCSENFFEFLKNYMEMRKVY